MAQVAKAKSRACGSSPGAAHARRKHAEYRIADKHSTADPRYNQLKAGIECADRGFYALLTGLPPRQSQQPWSSVLIPVLLDGS